MGRDPLVPARPVDIDRFAHASSFSHRRELAPWGTAAPNAASSGLDVVVSLAGSAEVLVQGGWGGALTGGPGAYVQATGQNGAAWQGFVPVTPGQKLYVEVGSNGKVNGGVTFAGGGSAGTPDPEGAEAASGGGASDARTCSERVTRCPGGGTSTQSRLLVAGGAGRNGGGGVTTGAGLSCRAGQGGASATNEQPLPKGNPATGPVPIVTASGTVISGYATGQDFKVMTSAGITDFAPPLLRGALDCLDDA